MTSKKNNSNNEENQLDFSTDEQALETNGEKYESTSSAADRRPKRKPATEVMKIVASKTLDHKAMAKTFSKDETNTFGIFARLLLRTNLCLSLGAHQRFPKKNDFLESFRGGR